MYMLSKVYMTVLVRLGLGGILYIYDWLQVMRYRYPVLDCLRW